MSIDSVIELTVGMPVEGVRLCCALVEPWHQSCCLILPANKKNVVHQQTAGQAGALKRLGNQKN
jgi:hypothetical protein